LIDNPKNVSKVIAKLYPVLNEMLIQHLVWKIQTDTYQREIERYGENTMIDSEFIFWQDSEMILDYLKLKPNFANDEIELLFSFYAVDCFLNSFSLSNSEKLDLMNTLQESFKNEFNADKNLKKELDKHYRELSTAIANLLAGKAQNEFSEMIQIVHHKNNKITGAIAAINEKLEMPIASFLMSHIHMMINRQYTSKQRMYELILYDHLYRYYKTEDYLQKK
jgi:thiopeptide-type bacteriocin biosynthesis protein